MTLALVRRSATAPAPADADAASATSRPITRIAAVQATAAETRVVEAGGERFDLAVAESSQVVEAGVYEGGRELWECAIDLVEWLAAHRRPSGTVLELGCGRGLPGLWCLKRGAQQVVFSDYDADVLERYTRLTRRASAAEAFFTPATGAGCPRRLSGDGFGTFDLILSAETAYREDTTRSLVECIARTLSATGEAIVATKRYYFGCGGGVAALENEIGRVDRLCCEVVWSAEDGRSNVRDILRVFWKKGGWSCVLVSRQSRDAHRALVHPICTRLALQNTRAVQTSLLLAVERCSGVFARVSDWGTGRRSRRRTSAPACCGRRQSAWSKTPLRATHTHCSPDLLTSKATHLCDRQQSKRDLASIFEAIHRQQSSSSNPRRQSPDNPDLQTAKWAKEASSPPSSKI